MPPLSLRSNIAVADLPYGGLTQTHAGLGDSLDTPDSVVTKVSLQNCIYPTIRTQARLNGLGLSLLTPRQSPKTPC